MSDAELQAYVDGMLAPADRSRVESFLSACPEERDRIDAYRRQNVQLHRLFDWAAHRPLPRGHELLARKLAGKMRLQRYMSNAPRIAAAALVVAAFGGVGWAGYHWLAPGGAPLLAFGGKGAESYVVLVGEDRSDFGSDGGSEAVARRSAEMLSALSARESTLPRQPPDLEKAGFRLLGARTMSTAIGPAVQFLYGSGNDHRVTLFLRPGSGDRPTAATVADNGERSMIYSERDNVAYSLVGNVDRQTILDLATLVSDTLTAASPAAAAPEKPRSAPALAPEAPAPADEQPPPRRGDGLDTRGAVAPGGPPDRPPQVIKTGLTPPG